MAEHAVGNMAVLTGTTAAPGKPPWLAALDGLCQPCSDAQFYGLRKHHADCHHGDCQCTYVIPAEWPAGTWHAPGRG